MSEDYYRRTLILILTAFIRMLVIFATMWAEQHHNGLLQRYKNDAVRVYHDLLADIERVR